MSNAHAKRIAGATKSKELARAPWATIETKLLISERLNLHGYLKNNAADPPLVLKITTFQSCMPCCISAIGATQCGVVRTPKHSRLAMQRSFLPAHFYCIAFNWP